MLSCAAGTFARQKGTGQIQCCLAGGSPGVEYRCDAGTWQVTVPMRNVSLNKRFMIADHFAASACLYGQRDAITASKLALA